jgi:cobaltochelatase CobT
MLRGKKARLPLPSRSLPADEVAAVRGAGDAYALKLAYHQDSIDRDLKPAGGDASAISMRAEQGARGSDRLASLCRACATISRLF